MGWQGNTSAVAIVPGQILTIVSYAPAVQAVYTVDNLTGLTALDTVNLTASFTPSSTKALVSFKALMQVAASGDYLGFGLLPHGGGAQIGLTVQAIASSVSKNYTTISWYLTGLAAGVALAFDIAGGVVAGSGSVYAGGAQGEVVNGYAPALIIVESA